MIHLLIGLPLAYAIVSVSEWYVHRYHMHRRGWMNFFQPGLHWDHQVIHHVAYRDDFEHPDDHDRADTGVPSGLFETLKLSLPLAIALGLFLPIEGLILLAMSAFHSAMWTAFHREMHQPEGRWFAESFWYRRCRQHHLIHHQNPKVNFCGFFLGADYLFATAAK